ncbi:MAG: translocation/assembly module TamB domain-containing protein [Fimbriimonadaceae bacterium]|nr:translocation/assembly module TamB domain-containing protein [Fimbriimonadaceae bacterium]
MRWVRLVWRALVSSLRLVTWVMPASMAVLCGAYAYDCFERVRAPGIPIKYVYLSETGEKIAVRASSYAIDPKNLTVRVYGARVDGPGGETAVKVDAIRIVNKDGRWDVFLSGVRGRVERLPDGKYSFMRLLPKREESKDETPFRVFARDLELTYVDATAEPSLPQVVSAKRFRVEGAGPRVLALGEVDLRGLGKIPIRVSVAPDQVEVRTKFVDSELVRALPHVRRWLDPALVRDWSPANADSLRATGPLRVVVAKDKPFLIDGDLRANATGLTVTDVVSGGRATFTAKFDANQAAILGQVVEPRREASIDGTIAYAEGFTIAGRVAAKSSSQADLWAPLRKALPRDVRFSVAEWSGVLAWNGKDFAADGDLKARTVIWQGEAIQGSAWRLAIDGDKLAAKTDRGTWSGIPFRGAIEVDFKSKRLNGWAKAERTDLGGLVRRFDGDHFAGSVSLQAVLTGTTERPSVALAAQGQAIFRPDNAAARYLGLFDARGRLDGDRVMLDRFALTGTSGAANGYGTFDLKSKNLTGNFTAGGIDLREIHPDLTGTAFVASELSGTLENPILSGRAEVYGAQLRDYLEYEVPVASAQLRVDREGMTATNVELSVGATDATGDLTWNFGSGALDGSVSAKRIGLDDWIGPDIEGLASIENAHLRGTVDEPILEATAKLVGLRAYGFDAQSAEVTLLLDKDKALVSRGQILVAPEESAEFSGIYTFKTKEGAASGTFSKIPLDHFTQYTDQIEIDGAASGKFTLTATDQGLQTLGTEINVDEISLNDTSLGVGTATLTKDVGGWKASAQVGEPGRYLLVPESTYDPIAERIQAEVTSYNFPLETIIRIFQKQVDGLSADPKQLVMGIKGALSGQATISGNSRDPDLTMDQIVANKLTVAGRDAGQITLGGSRTAGVWDVKSLAWNEGQPGEPKAVLQASGNVDENGSLAVRGDLQNFDLSWIGSVIPTFPPLVGRAGFAFVMGGRTKRPNLEESSLTTEGLGYLGSDGKPETLPVNLLVSDMSIIDGLLSANGFVSFKDFSGKLEAKLPLESFVNENPAKPEQGLVTLTANPRDLADLDETFAWLDTKRSTGKLGGSIQFEGVPGKYRLTGSLLTDGIIAAKGLDTTLKGFQFDTGYEGKVLSFGGRTESSDGGTLETDGTVRLADMPKGRFDLKDWLLQCQLQGAIQSKGLTVVQNPLSKSNRMQAIVSGSLALAGNLSEPRIQGIPNQPILISGVNATIPSEFASSPGGEIPLINPRFDSIALRLDGPARVRTSTSDITLTGGGTIAGTLQYPNLTADLTVEKGIFRLPSNRVELESGGTLAFSYSTGQYVEPKARLDVKLEGRTSVSARRYGDTIERYDVYLDLRGDLLQDGGVNITASSDPPDLSQEQILSILGQRDLIESFARATLAPGSSAAREAVLGYFLPSLVSPLTDSLASGLNLDFVAIEYNPFDQTVITAAKTLAKGLTLIARRQVNTLPGQKPRYEIKLTYRPPFRNLLIGRSRFGVGFDQDRPWKITFEYGIRF